MGQQKESVCFTSYTSWHGSKEERTECQTWLTKQTSMWFLSFETEALIDNVIQWLYKTSKRCQAAPLVQVVPCSHVVLDTPEKWLSALENACELFKLEELRNYILKSEDFLAKIIWWGHEYSNTHQLLHSNRWNKGWLGFSWEDRKTNRVKNRARVGNDRWISNQGHLLQETLHWVQPRPRSHLRSKVLSLTRSMLSFSQPHTQLIFPQYLWGYINYCRMLFENPLEKFVYEKKKSQSFQSYSNCLWTSSVHWQWSSSEWILCV